MKRDHHEDGSLLGAYADDELGPDETAAIEARLHNDAGLRRDLEEIRALKPKLAALRPPEEVGGSAPERPVRRGRPKRFVATAVAAAAAVVAVAGVALLAWQNLQPMTDTTVAALHERLSRSTYVINETHVARLVSGGQTLEFRAPDLTASQLFLVDVANSQPGEAYAIGVHYRGRSGCRLTVVAIQDTVELELPDADRLLRMWTLGGTSFAVIADGMDPQRFASIADFVQAAIEEDARRHSELRFAMAESYRAARPCA